MPAEDTREEATPEAAQRRLLFPDAANERIGEGSLRHAGLDGARQNVVRRDLVLAELQRQRLRQAGDRVLGRRIG